MADGASTDTPENVIEAFIAEEVGWHTPLMREQARDLLAALSSAGWQIVRGDEYEQVGWMDAEFIWPLGMRSGDVETDVPVWRRVGDR
jgi:hypothetical protein